MESRSCGRTAERNPGQETGSGRPSRGLLRRDGSDYDVAEFKGRSTKVF